MHVCGDSAKVAERFSPLSVRCNTFERAVVKYGITVDEAITIKVWYREELGCLEILRLQGGASMRHSVRGSSGARLPTLAGAHAESHDLLSTLFQSSTMGVAICDRQLRYRAVNDPLAALTGIPAAAHLGKTIHAVLGSVAAKVQPALEHVFATGELLPNLELTAELPSRGAIVHWNRSYFPIKNRAGQVRQVGVIVLELTKERELEAALLRLTDKLTVVSASLRHHRAAQPSTSADACPNVQDVFTSSVTLLQSCLSEGRAIAKLLHT